MTIQIQTFEKFRVLIYNYSGITLKDGKRTMLESRINKRLRALNLDTYEDYLSYVTKSSHKDELVNMIDEVSTNITHFFRDAPHFTFLEKHIKSQIQDGQKKFRIWCCAASTGQEPYSIAMVMHKLTTDFPGQYDIKILATDISTQVLKSCEQGHYTPTMLEDIPQKYRTKYFTKISGQDLYEVDLKLKKLITFKRLNLSIFPFPLKNKLDIVFIRNVMIYFDKETKHKILENIHNLLHNKGIVITGSTESLTGVHDNFSRLDPSIYQVIPNQNNQHKAAS